MALKNYSAANLIRGGSETLSTRCLLVASPGVSRSDYIGDYDNDLTKAIMSIGSTEKTLYVDTICTTSRHEIVPSTLRIIMIEDGLINHGAYNLTINGPFPDPGPYQVFSGTGTVAGLNEVYPEWWGAVGDDSTDCTTAIQAAIDSVQNTITAINQSGGGTIRFSKGIYIVTSQIQVPSHIRLVGLGMHTSFIKNTGTGVALRFFDLASIEGNKTVKNSSIADIGILGDADTSHGILIENAVVVNIDRVYIYGHGGVGIDVVGGAYSSTWGQNVFIQGCWITTNTVGGIRCKGAYRHTLLNITNNSIIGGGKYNIYLENGWVVNIIGNEIASLGYSEKQGIAINRVDNVTIKGNSFESMSGSVGHPVCYIRTGYNGDTQVDTDSAVCNLNIRSNIFNPGAPDVDVLYLRGVIAGEVKRNYFYDGIAGGTNRAFVLDNNASYPQPLDISDNQFHGTTNITPFTIISNEYHTTKLALPTYGTTVNISANENANQFKVVNTDSVAFTINNPTGFSYNQVITIIITNSHPGLSTAPVVWDTAYKLSSPWINPIYGNQIAISFRLDPDDNWYEISRSNNMGIQVNNVVLSNANLKALAGTPIELVPAQGSNAVIEVISAALFLNYSGGVLAEPTPPDDLAIEYDNGAGVQIVTWDVTGWITAAADATEIIKGAALSATNTTSLANKNVVLINTGDDYTGVASTSTAVVAITYVVHRSE